MADAGKMFFRNVFASFKKSKSPSVKRVETAGPKELQKAPTINNESPPVPEIALPAVYLFYKGKLENVPQSSLC